MLIEIIVKFRIIYGCFFCLQVFVSLVDDEYFSEM